VQPILERVLPGQEPPLSPTQGLEHLDRVTLALLPTINQELLQDRDMEGHHRHRAILEVPILDMEGHHHRSSRPVMEAQGHSKATLEVAQVTQERHHLSSNKAMVVPLSSNRSTLKSPDGFKQLTQTEVVR